MSSGYRDGKMEEDRKAVRRLEVNVGSLSRGREMYLGSNELL